MCLIVYMNIFLGVGNLLVFDKFKNKYRLWYLSNNG